ncbi:PucR family transcriptional regulator [Streptomyces heilongjiangensis]|uniref:PucR family transcriptional regulator n=1 Tax=Streptomyces heilongjiangensis TaxID=945052 RepID=A0ABW1BL11_9ACTN|nr:PucR family transcriptional regulator [Streptomyces heilongjiangensis]MDC2952454.1 PucR family transcriptional regulator [Streptomyces heilongjiangensis]
MWELPSPPVRELMLRGARIVLNDPDELLKEVDEATLTGDAMREVASDPVLAADARRTNRAGILLWVTANVRDPGARVPANLGEEELAFARDLVRRGLQAHALESYRVGQAVCWGAWMRIAFSLTSDTDELRELLDVSHRSITDFIDATIVAVSRQMERERDELTRGTGAERREMVALILDGAPIGRLRAEATLGHRLDGTHTAAVVWSEDPDSDLRELDRAAEELARAAKVSRPLVVMPGAATRWVWVHGRPDTDELRTSIMGVPTVRIAVGSAAVGLDGFRRSHLDALTTQRLMTRHACAHAVAVYDDIELVFLLTQDPDRADRFVKRTLGDLETAGTDVIWAVLTYIQEQCNASRAAERLYIHRNTLLRRLARAERLLPRPVEQNTLAVGAALEILRWRGRP